MSRVLAIEWVCAKAWLQQEVNARTSAIEGRQKLRNRCASAETREGDALHHIASRLNRHPGAIRERLAALTGAFRHLVSGEATSREWAGSLPPDPPQRQRLIWTDYSRDEGTRTPTMSPATKSAVCAATWRGGTNSSKGHARRGYAGNGSGGGASDPGPQGQCEDQGDSSGRRKGKAAGGSSGGSSGRKSCKTAAAAKGKRHERRPEVTHDDVI